MADGRPIHTMPTAGGWAGRREGSGWTGKKYLTKAEAEAVNRRTARRGGVKHISHRKDDAIGERRSYRNDPHPPKDGH